ncbi:MAG: hypothetical protein QOI12_4511 [Alphaproteobacteria bacterium]|nr:hypothetical protein [Alphaproteobacteria bacterium]
MEARHVASERELNHHRIVGALISVVAIEPPPQPARLHPDDRIDARVEIRGAAKRLDRDGIALDAPARASERLMHDVAEEGGEPGRGDEHLALRNLAERLPDVGFARLWTRQYFHYHYACSPAPSHALPHIMHV